MSELDPFDIKSIEDLDNLSKDKIKELLSESEFYIMENDHYEFNDSQLAHLEKTIELIKSKISGKPINNSYETIPNEQLLNETFKMAFKSEFSGTMFPWFTLIRYADKTKKHIVNTVSEDGMSDESWVVSEGLDALLKKHSEKIISFTLCYEGEIELDGQTFNTVTVEHGVKGSEHSQYYYQRYSCDNELVLIDKEPVKWVDTPSRYSS